MTLTLSHNCWRDWLGVRWALMVGRRTLECFRGKVSALVLLHHGTMVKQHQAARVTPARNFSRPKQARGVSTPACAHRSRTNCPLKRRQGYYGDSTTVTMVAWVSIADRFVVYVLSRSPASVRGRLRR